VQPEAARAWIEQQTPLEEQATGTPDGVTAVAPGSPFPVLAENAPVLELFLRLQTQWRVAPSGRLRGLRYDAAETVMRRFGLRGKRRLFAHLQDMEQAVIEGQGDD
jgi:hypothetical protein